MITVELTQEGVLDMMASKRIRIKIDLEPGQALYRLPTGAFVAVPGRSPGPSYIEIEPGEKLHFLQEHRVSIGNKKYLIPAGWIIQPSGAPTISARWIAKLINREMPWIYRLTRRGPLFSYGGLQAYILNDEGNSWVPKIGGESSGTESMMYYESDVLRWKDAYAPPAEEEQEREAVQHLSVPAPKYKVFKEIGNKLNAEDGYVTRTKLMAEAKELTRRLSLEEIKERYGLEKPISDRDYDYIRAVAVQEGWADNPRKKHNTGSYRQRGMIPDSLSS